MSTEASKGKIALDKRDYKSAIAHLSAALKSSQAPSWLLQRSTAYHRLGQYELALADADNAVLAGISRGKRELIAEAHCRRGIAFHGLKQYGNAKMCFQWSSQYNEKLPGLSIWIAKTSKDFVTNGGGEAQCNGVTVKEVPDRVEEIQQASPLSDDKSEENPDNSRKIGSEGTKPVTVTIRPTPLSKIRHEWYQSQDTVAIEILAKGVPKESASVQIQEKSLEVSFPIASSQSTYSFNLEPLFSNVDTTRSSYRITPHKIEITLQKAKSGLKWIDLEAKESIDTNESAEAQSKVTADTSNSGPKHQAPMYPTSSRTGPKNWDTVVGDEPEDDNADGPDAFFKALYKNADADMKRAMIKSYQESNGTSLSTQWSDVGSRKFDTVPPEGVEAKRWDA
ncbi:hypothetical protein K3495_g9525 [Podosphaera aphanis]|nr:hypothetical protein K3495_g9525 [Podosphaera aphanis]